MIFDFFQKKKLNDVFIDFSFFGKSFWFFDFFRAMIGRFFTFLKLFQLVETFVNFLHCFEFF